MDDCTLQRQKVTTLGAFNREWGNSFDHSNMTKNSFKIYAGFMLVWMIET